MNSNEPVAWMEIEEGGITEYKVWREPVSSKSIPLYTHPAKTLTDEEIDNAITEAFNRGARFGYAEGLKKASEK